MCMNKIKSINNLKKHQGNILAIPFSQIHWTFQLSNNNCENYHHLLYKYKFSHLDFYSDIGIIVNKNQSGS